MKTQIKATLVGNYAHESLQSNSEGKVMGATSRGIFLLLGNKTLFLTTDTHHSPFNISFSLGSPLPQDIISGDPVFFSHEELLIPSREVTISLQDVPIWTPPLPAQIVNSIPDQEINARKILDILKILDLKKGYLFLDNRSSLDTPEQSKIRRFASAFLRSFRANDLNACLEISSHLFGLGTGLTPSGDDWLTGFFLYQICTDIARKISRPFIAGLGPEMIYGAYKKTTTVSANRLEAAQKGWSEELFLSCINYLFDPTSGDPQALAEGLYNFGHSSGVDTFIGIAYSCKALE
jgi:Protein of unknown function (DUF2877)